MESRRKAPSKASVLISPVVCPVADVPKDRTQTTNRVRDLATPPHCDRSRDFVDVVFEIDEMTSHPQRGTKMFADKVRRPSALSPRQNRRKNELVGEMLVDRRSGSHPSFGVANGSPCNGFH